MLLDQCQHIPFPQRADCGVWKNVFKIENLKSRAESLLFEQESKKLNLIGRRNYMNQFAYLASTPLPRII